MIIFNYATAPTSSLPDSEIRDFRKVVLLTHVSHRWRKILIDYGPIWSDVHIYGQNIDMLSAQIERCKGAPLFVYIRTPSGNTGALRYLKPQNVREAANLIRGHRDQVTRLKVRLRCRFFQQFLGFEWPILEELDLNDICHLNLGLHGASCDGGLPRLRYLTIQGGFNWAMKVAKNLTTLKLQGPMDLQLAAFAEFLRANTSLESLSLIHLDALGSPGRREEPINLPHLNALLVHHAKCECVLALLTLPSLGSLAVSSTGGQSFWSDSPWSGFVSRLSITSLKAQYYSPSYGSITVVGSNGLDPQPLYLKEFSHTTATTALFRLLSNPSLSSVTSFSFVDNMPEGFMSRQQISVICGLLDHLSRVECMRLCPSGLAIEVVRRLGDDSELCPGLRGFEIMVTDRARDVIEDLVYEVLEARSGSGDGWQMRATRYSYLEGLPLMESRTKMVWEKATPRNV